MKQPDDPTRPHFYVLQLETVEGHGWTSLHITYEDAERKLEELEESWGISRFIVRGDGAVRSYGISHLPVHNVGE